MPDPLVDNIENKTESEQSGIRGVPRRSSVEAERLKQVLESKYSDSDDIDELESDFDDLSDSDAEGNFLDADEMDTGKFNELLSQVSLEGDETEDELLATEDEKQASDDQDKEGLTPKPPRKRRNLLTSYLKNKNQ